MILPKVDLQNANPQPGLLPAIGLAVETLSHAFHADPLFVHFFPNAASRRQYIQHIFGLQLRVGLEFGEVHVTSTACEGVAVWLPTDKIDLDWLTYLKIGGLGLFRRLGLGNLARLLAADKHLAALHRRNFPTNGLYLALLGVHPSRQRQGFAGQLLAPQLARLDQAQRPACLETENARNVPLYQRFGFHVTEEVTLAKSGVRCWAMVRPPAI